LTAGLGTCLGIGRNPPQGLWFRFSFIFFEVTGRQVTRLPPASAFDGSPMSASSPQQAAWLPRLVIAPSFVVSLLFIYGLMAWNG